MKRGGRPRRSRSGSTCPRRWVTSWCCARSARPAAPLSRWRRGSAWPTSRVLPATGGHLHVPRGCRDRLGRAPAAPRPGWSSAGDEVALLNTGAGVIYPGTVEVDVPTIAKDGVLTLERRFVCGPQRGNPRQTADESVRVRPATRARPGAGRRSGRRRRRPGRRASRPRRSGRAPSPAPGRRSRRSRAGGR